MLQVKEMGGESALSGINSVSPSSDVHGVANQLIDLRQTLLVNIF